MVAAVRSGILLLGDLADLRLGDGCDLVLVGNAGALFHDRMAFRMRVGVGGVLVTKEKLRSA